MCVCVCVCVRPAYTHIFERNFFDIKIKVDYLNSY